MKKLFSFALCALFILSCAPVIPDLTGDIQGVVKDYSHGGMISNCMVTLNPGGKSVTTTSAGTYDFLELEAGEYTLTFSKAGYDDESLRVTVVPGQVSQADILLKPKSPFGLSQSVLDFGDYETNKVINIYNSTDSDCSYEISNIPEWLSLNNTAGTVPSGSQVTVTAVADRDKVGYGKHSQILTFTYNGNSSGSVSLKVTMEKVRLTAPVVSCRQATSVTETSFEISGEIVQTGGQQITAYGHCWSTSSQPTVSDSKTSLGTTASTGPFTSLADGLAEDTKYYVRAYATNSQGTSYSEEVIVTTKAANSEKWDGKIADSFDSGSGTAAKPYVIKTGGQLMLMQKHSDKYFVLANNIDLDNINWKPFEFRGILDGKGFTISNLYIKRTEDRQGLFSFIQESGCVRNLTISGVRIEAPEYDCIGAIAGSMYGGNVENCKVVFKEGSEICGKDYVGGIAGDRVRNTFITGCTVESHVSEYVIIGNDNVGGICGYGYVFEDCVVSADICGRDYVGGIAGEVFADYSDSDAIVRSGYEGKIYGRSSVGGIVGEVYSGQVKACRAIIDMTVENDAAGGISGYKGSVIACYADGVISISRSAGNVGGLIGDAWSASSVFSYSTVSCTSEEYGPVLGGNHDRDTDCASVYDGCTDITTFMKECYSDYADLWNFSNTWTWKGNVDGKEVSVSCPRLAWE